MSKPTFKRLPCGIGLERNTVVSSAKMYSIIPGEDLHSHPVNVYNHGLRTTKNAVGSSDGADGSSSSNNPNDVRNTQRADTAITDARSEGLLVEFTFAPKSLEGIFAIYAPNLKKTTLSAVAEYKQSIDDFLIRAKSSEGAAEICRRYARNVLNGRWLWRNRRDAESISIEVFVNGECMVTEDALSIPLNQFSGYTQAEVELAQLFLKNFQGVSRNVFTIRAHCRLLGKGEIDVYPSQNFIENKKKGLGRSLYVCQAVSKEKDVQGRTVKGFAAIRDVKVSNALRTFDTWYDNEKDDLTPIPVEPLGASLEHMQFFRKNANSSFKLLGRLNEIDASSTEGMFMIAVFMRGGVHTEGSEK